MLVCLSAQSVEDGRVGGLQLVRLCSLMSAANSSKPWDAVVTLPLGVFLVVLFSSGQRADTKRKRQRLLQTEQAFGTWDAQHRQGWAAGWAAQPPAWRRVAVCDSDLELLSLGRLDIKSHVSCGVLSFYSY